MADSWLRPALAVLVGFTGLSCLQVAFAPVGPVAVLGPGPGPIAGYTATHLRPRPGRRNRDWDLSATERLAWRPTDGPGAVIELSRTALATRRRRDLQVAALTASEPALALKQRRLVPVASGEIGLGTIDGQAALQGCRSWNGRSVVRGKAFLKVPNPPATTTAERLSRLLGLTPNSRYSCELLTLSTTPGPGAEERLKAVWDRI